MVKKLIFYFTVFIHIHLSLTRISSNLWLINLNGIVLGCFPFAVGNLELLVAIWAWQKLKQLFRDKIFWKKLIKVGVIVGNFVCLVFEISRENECNRVWYRERELCYHGCKATWYWCVVEWWIESWDTCCCFIWREAKVHGIDHDNLSWYRVTWFRHQVW